MNQWASVDPEDALRYGYWETGRGGIKHWVPTSEYTVTTGERERSKHLDNNQEPPVKGRRPVLKRSLCDNCGCLLFGDENCLCKPERKHR